MMIFGNDRDALRQSYFDAWKKANRQQPLTALEQQIVDVIALHPEYHRLFEDSSESKLSKEYLPEIGESNPFLHMGLHLGIRDQLATDRPKGMKTLFHKLINKTPDLHQAEHLFMETLAESIWFAQKHNQAPDDAKYLNRLKKKIKTI